MAQDVIIIGGGVIGCSIAVRLAEAGLKATLIERGRAGCEASRAAAGMMKAWRMPTRGSRCTCSKTRVPSMSSACSRIIGA